jgi:hypothetical protein
VTANAGGRMRLRRTFADNRERNHSLPVRVTARPRAENRVSGRFCPPSFRLSKSLADLPCPLDLVEIFSLFLSSHFHNVAGWLGVGPGVNPVGVR